MRINGRTILDGILGLLLLLLGILSPGSLWITSRPALIITGSVCIAFFVADIVKPGWSSRDADK